MKPVDPRELWVMSDVIDGDRKSRDRSLAELKRILDYLPQMVWVSLRSDPPVEHYNRHFRDFTGVRLSPDGLTRRELIHPDDREAAVGAWRRAQDLGESYQAQYRIRHHSGEYRWILSRGDPQRSDAGIITCWYGTCTDVDDEVRATQALDVSEALNRSIIQSSTDCIKLVDSNGRLVFMNESAVRELGERDSSSFIGKPWTDTLSAASESAAAHALKEALRGRTARFTTTHHVGNGVLRWRDYLLSPVLGGDGRADRVVVSSRDVTEERQIHEKLKWASNHDGLTLLPNRSYFHECVQEAIRQSDGTGRRVGILRVDVDQLNQINDGLGHDAGDRLLTVFAERLRNCVGPHDVVGRLGGDEFGLLLFDISSPADVLTVADRILERLREPFEYDGRLIDCRASIGGSLYPDQSRHKAELMKFADLALYSAKKAGRLQAVMFEPSMRAELQTRASMLALTRDALRDGRVIPYYQSKVDLQTGAIVGFEALLRWQDRRGNVHLPGTIAAAFEDKELAPAITDKIMDVVIDDLRCWTSEGHGFGHVAINASAPDFRSSDFADRLLDRLDRARLPASCIQLEVTETVFVGRGAECVESALAKLSSAGVRIALDDFGTGYASLSHLKRFPVDVLKIDQSFVRDVEEESEDTAIIKGVINLARSLKIEVVAEGIETMGQLRFLIANGCHVGQGYLFSRAVAGSQVPLLLQQETGPDAAGRQVRL